MLMAQVSTMDEIEVKYQCAFALKCAGGLQFPPLTIAVTSPVISHTVSASGLSQQTKAVDYQSADVTSVVGSHLGSLRATGSPSHEGYSHGVLG